MNPSDPSISTTVEFYWRPGCGFCLRLDRDLTDLGVAVHRRNIWEDPEAAAIVRSHANGNETVPTVVIANTALVNPTADEVVSVLQVHAPELVPSGWVPPEPSRLGQVARRLLGG